MSKELSVVDQRGSAGFSLAPVMSVGEAVAVFKQFNQFVSNVMHDGIDYGKIPGTSKATLLKPGAEKLTTFFGLSVAFNTDKEIEDFDKPLFFYRVTCVLRKGDALIASASGSCNSMEDRYAYRWVVEADVPSNLDKGKLQRKESTIGEWGWAYDKRESAGKYGKPEEYWQKYDRAIQEGTIIRKTKVQPWNNKEAVYLEIQDYTYRIPNPEIFTLANTILKMAEKRALIAATLIGCNASEYFTQDMEDIVGVIDAEFSADIPVVQPAPAPVSPIEQVVSAPEAEPDNSLTPGLVRTHDEYVVLRKRAGMGEEDAKAIYMECGRDYSRAYDQILKQYGEVLR